MLNDEPRRVWIETADGLREDDGAAAATSVGERRWSFALESDEPVCRVLVEWNVDVPPSARVLGDAWERAYGDLAWQGLRPERVFPWYLLVCDGDRMRGVGIKTSPAAMCWWGLTPSTLTLCMDVRSGSRPVELRGRRLVMAETVSLEGDEPFAATRELCTAMCDSPRMPAEPVYGFNDWYYRYGKNSADTVRADAALLAELAPDGANRPFCVIDAGWQAAGAVAGGPWDRANEKTFPDMAALADDLRGLGVRPGIWLRPLLYADGLPADGLLRKTDEGLVADPSRPDVLEFIARQLRTIVGEWGYELVKHDFTCFDCTGLWGYAMGRRLSDGIEFADRSRTTAEIVTRLYATIREACSEAVVIACNALSHLSAGLFEIQRTGDDTSGRDWLRTRIMGINALSHRLPQHETFYAVDADCVGLTRAVPWELNAQWLDLLSRSGTPLFISPEHEAIGAEQRSALREALARAAEPQPAAEPVDWMLTTCPQRWRFGDDERRYCWDAAPLGLPEIETIARNPWAAGLGVR